jgi:hypothetical protein
MNILAACLAYLFESYTRLGYLCKKNHAFIFRKIQVFWYCPIITFFCNHLPFLQCPTTKEIIASVLASYGEFGISS